MLCAGFCSWAFPTASGELSVYAADGTSDWGQMGFSSEVDTAPLCAEYPVFHCLLDPPRSLLPGPQAARGELLGKAWVSSTQVCEK